MPSSLLILLLASTSIVGMEFYKTSSEKGVAEAKEESLLIGNERLCFRVIRGASPTVVLESGGGMDSSQWKYLQPEIARVTGLAVVSYDRPGFGASDLPTSPYDVTRDMRELRLGLRRLGLSREVILVGHSYGALLNQVYASQDPKSVRGVVLIDPNTVEFMDSIGGHQELTKDFRYEGPHPPPKADQALQRKIAGFEEAVTTFRSAAFPLDVPMVVITAENPWWPTEERNNLFRAAHESIVEENPSRALRVADDSGHIVTADRPDIVLAAVQDIVAKIRSQTPPNKPERGNGVEVPGESDHH